MCVGHQAGADSGLVAPAERPNGTSGRSARRHRSARRAAQLGASDLAQEFFRQLRFDEPILTPRRKHVEAAVSTPLLSHRQYYLVLLLVPIEGHHQKLGGAASSS